MRLGGGGQAGREGSPWAVIRKSASPAACPHWLALTKTAKRVIAKRVKSPLVLFGPFSPSKDVNLRSSRLKVSIFNRAAMVHVQYIALPHTTYSPLLFCRVPCV